MKLLWVIFSLALTWTGVVGYNQLYDQECSYQDETRFCRRAAALYCQPDTNKCECLGGELDSKYAYNLEWDAEKNQCLAALNSACVNTTGSSRVECKTGLVCNQIQGYVESVGICATGGAFGVHLSTGLIALLVFARLALSI